MFSVVKNTNGHGLTAKRLAVLMVQTNVSESIGLMNKLTAETDNATN